MLPPKTAVQLQRLAKTGEMLMLSRRRRNLTMCNMVSVRGMAALGACSRVWFGSEGR